MNSTSLTTRESDDGMWWIEGLSPDGHSLGPFDDQSDISAFVSKYTDWLEGCCQVPTGAKARGFELCVAYEWDFALTPQANDIVIEEIVDEVILVYATGIETVTKGMTDG